MKNVTLQFPSNHNLWLFRKTIKLPSLRVNRVLITLTCACFADDINIAVTSYGAKIVETESPVSLEAY